MIHITLNGQSWHARYYRWVFGTNFPKVLCPYFWQVVFLIIVIPFILMYKGLCKIVETIDQRPEPILNSEQRVRKGKRRKIWSKIAEILGKVFCGIIITIGVVTILAMLYIFFTSGKMLEILLGLFASIGVAVTIVGTVWVFVEERWLQKLGKSMVIQVPYQMVVGLIHKACPIITWVNMPVEEEY